MTQTSEPTTIKKYANRRLYHTGTSTYVTLDDLAEMVKGGEDFVVVDAKTKEDLTRSVLTQIIFEQEAKGENLLPISFLRQLIQFYGDSMQSIVPSYLDFSMSSLMRDQDKIREEFTKSFGGTAGAVPGLSMMEDQTRRNIELFQKSMSMFMPFGNSSEMRDEAAGSSGDQTVPEAREKSATDGDLDALRQQMEAMQQQLAELAKK